MSLSLARLALMILALVLSLGQRISAAQPTGEAAPAPRLYAAEIQVGTGWDPAKPAQDQTHFAEHSANIRRLLRAWDAASLGHTPSKLWDTRRPRSYPIQPLASLTTAEEEYSYPTPSKIPTPHGGIC